MQIKENITLYKCDFCKKELKRKHAMEIHENQCNSNPINQRPCLSGCSHLGQRDIEYYTGTDNYQSGEPNYRKGLAFYCELKDKFMLHPKLEYKDNVENLQTVYFENKEVEQEWMPKKCGEFNGEWVF